MNRKRKVLALALAAVALAAGCSNQSGAAPTSSEGSRPQTSQPDAQVSKQEADPSRTTYPLTVDNCGIKVTFDAPPKRAVTLNQTVTEIMLALGLQDSMVGTAFLQGSVLPEFQAAYAKIPVLADRYPSDEKLLEVTPDFVYAGLAGSLGENPLEGRDKLTKLGIRVFQASEYCSANPDAKTGPLTMDVLYRDIEDIAAIFDVKAKGAAVISDLKKQVAEVRKAVSGVEKPVRVARLALMDASSVSADGVRGIGNLVIDLAGGVNVFGDLDGRLNAVSWEQVVERNPQVIFFTNIKRGPEKDTEFLNTFAPIAGVDAVTQQRYFSIGGEDVLLGVRTTRGIRALAEYLYPERFPSHP